MQIDRQLANRDRQHDHDAGDGREDEQPRLPAEAVDQPLADRREHHGAELGSLRDLFGIPAFIASPFDLAFGSIKDIVSTAVHTANARAKIPRHTVGQSQRIEAQVDFSFALDPPGRFTSVKLPATYLPAGMTILPSARMGYMVSR